MATDYNITIKRYNGTDYDTLYPTVRNTNIEGTVQIAKGGTGASSAATARTNLSVYSKTEADTAITTALNAKITYGTTDLTAGTSPLEEGVLYFVYE